MYMIYRNANWTLSFSFFLQHQENLLKEGIVVGWVTEKRKQQLSCYVPA
jgi:hypothetical protein